MNGRRNKRPTDQLESVSLTGWYDTEARRRAALVTLFSISSWDRSAKRSCLCENIRGGWEWGQSGKSLISDDIIEMTVLLFVLLSDWGQPAWPSPAAASGPPAPGPCRVTGPSASRSQLRSAHRATPRRQKTNKEKIRTPIQTIWLPFKTENLFWKSLHT